ncbi:Hypothetical predicted protein [Paramuricea clavata]|uniref:Uncharacterized protein n=1 Tax=Paramuricea clavata TaxID=317549 RepID=A0A6S7KI48_PARCT|nr:Hypothetical predicted protein [Paramuricea clavata]
MSWSGDFESLKRFVKESLNIVGTWSSPGGEKKLFSSSDVNIQCSFAEQCSDNIEVSSDKCQCTGVEMEGVKLDIVILEAKFNKQSDALEKLHNEMASLISKPKAAHLGESFTESTQNGENIPTECLQNDKIQRLEADIAILVRGRNFESSNHCNDMGNWNSEQCDHQSLDLINQGTKQKQMQKYGNRCLNDKAPVHEVSMVSLEIANEHVSEAEQHNITNNLPTTITDNSAIIIADECASEVDKHNITNNVPATSVNNTIIMADEREWLGHLPLIEAPNNTTNNLPTTITDNSTIIIADECVSEVDKHNITNNVPATTVNNTIIMTDEREWLGHLPLIEAPNPAPSKNLLYESTFNHTFRSRYNPEAPHQQFHKNKYNSRCIRKGQNFKRPAMTNHFSARGSTHYHGYAKQIPIQSKDLGINLDSVRNAVLRIEERCPRTRKALLRSEERCPQK